MKRQYETHVRWEPGFPEKRPGLTPVVAAVHPKQALKGKNGGRASWEERARERREQQSE